MRSLGMVDMVRDTLSPRPNHRLDSIVLNCTGRFLELHTVYTSTKWQLNINILSTSCRPSSFLPFPPNSTRVRREGLVSWVDQESEFHSLACLGGGINVHMILSVTLEPRSSLPWDHFDSYVILHAGRIAFYD
jgi:hypothetical protein